MLFAFLLILSSCQKAEKTSQEKLLGKWECYKVEHNVSGEVFWPEEMWEFTDTKIIEPDKVYYYTYKDNALFFGTDPDVVYSGKPDYKYVISEVNDTYAVLKAYWSDDNFVALKYTAYLRK